MRILYLFHILGLKSPSSDHDVLHILHTFATNKKSGYEHESAAIAFQSLSTILGPPVAPLLLPSLPVLFELLMDKGDVVRAGASTAIKTILKSFPRESTRVVFRALESILENGKWRTKVAALDGFKGFVNTARDEVASELAHILPKIEHAMHDTKSEASVTINLSNMFLNLALGVYSCY